MLDRMAVKTLSISQKEVIHGTLQIYDISRKEFRDIITSFLLYASKNAKL
jgi:hypothetical protein